MAFRIVARDHFKTECVEDALKLLQELVAVTRTEPGNIAYTYCRDVNAPDYFAMLESWDSQESMNAHLGSEHFQRILPQLASMMEEPSRVEVYEEVI